MFELERLGVEITLLGLGGLGALVCLRLLARTRRLGLLDLAGGPLYGLLLVLLAVVLRKFLGAVLLDL